MREPPEISVVVPVYGCRPCLRTLHQRLTDSLETVTDSFEIVLVDDRGPDDSWAVLVELARRDPRVRAHRLSRNFGQHAAITAGLTKARGARIVVMDCDLQHPPEEIPRLYAKALEGHEIVLAARKRRDSRWRRLAARAYFSLLDTLAGTSFDREYGTFSLISAKVRDAFLRFGERDRHYLMILFWLGFDHAAIEFEQPARAEGRSSYTPARLLRHAVDGVFFQTTALLRWIVYAGFCISALGGMLAAFLFVSRLFQHAYPGWTSLMVVILLLGGFIVVSTGVTGLYVGKVFEQVKERPLFVIDESFPPEESVSEGAGAEVIEARRRSARPSSSRA